MTPSELRDARLRAHLTQAQAAQKAGVDLRTWQRWEYGDIPMPRTERLWFLADLPEILRNFKETSIMKLIYIGDHFYYESGSAMSSIYTEDGYRSDWGKVKLALTKGESVSIVPATPQQRDFYEARLSEMKRERAKEKS